MFIVAIHLELPYIFIHVEDVLGFDVQSHSSCFSIIVVGGSCIPSLPLVDRHEPIWNIRLFFSS